MAYQDRFVKAHAPIHLSPEGQRAPTALQAIEAKSRFRRRQRRAREQGQFHMTTRELSASPVWLALIQHPKANAAYWFLVEQLHQNAGNQDGGLVCTRNQFKAWTGWGGDHDAREGLAILVQLGLVDMVDPGMRARNPRHSRPPRYALTTSPYHDNQRTNRWRSPECLAIAESLSKTKREVQRRGVTRKLAAHDDVPRLPHARVSLSTPQASPVRPSSGAYAPMSFEAALASMRQRRVLQ